MSRSLKLGFAGDVMLGRLVNESLARGDYARPWGDTLAALRTLDLFFVNLECALTARTERWPDGGYKPFYFRADPAAVRTLTLGRVDFASLANNHIGDFGPEGLRDTVAALDGAGIAHAGAGIDGWSAREPALLTAAATRVAVLAFADYPAEWAATAAAPGINYTPASLAREHFDEVRVALAVAREQADVVVFSIHWGPNMSEEPTPAFRDFAHAVIDAGADIFWGHSAHVPQGVELHHGRLILYDTGDFVDDYAVDAALRNDLSFLAVFDADREGVRRIELHPVLIDGFRGQVNPARGTEAEAVMEMMARRCRKMGTAVTRSRDTLTVEVVR